MLIAVEARREEKGECGKMEGTEKTKGEGDKEKSRRGGQMAWSEVMRPAGWKAYRLDNRRKEE